MLDVTEAGAVKAANTCIKIGAWVVPFCYRIEYGRLIGHDPQAAEEHEEAVDMVKGIGIMAQWARSGKFSLGIEDVQYIAKRVGPELQDVGVGYEDAFSPHDTKLFDHVVPLHDNET